MSTQRRERIRSRAKRVLAATLWLPLSCRSMRSKAEGKMTACAHHDRARASAFSWAPQRFVGICGSTSTFLLVCRTTCWRRTGQCTSRERRMAMLAGARSLHARPWERRYRHALGGVVRAWPLEPTSGRGAVSPRSPGSHRVSQWANPKMHPYWNQAKKCKGLCREACSYCSG